MSIITISRYSQSHGDEIAKKVAEKLNYESISRRILLEASEEFNIEELKLTHAIHDAPSILDRLSLTKEKYISFIKSALLKHLQKDNVVYHGLAGHFFVKDVPHALKVRIISDMHERVKYDIDKFGGQPEQILTELYRDDQERRNWSRYLYGIDTEDISLYDLIINLHRVTINHAVEIICGTVKLDEFKTTSESQKILDNAVTISEIESALLGKGYNNKVEDRAGEFYIQVKSTMTSEAVLKKEVKEIFKDHPALEKIHVTKVPVVSLTE